MRPPRWVAPALLALLAPLVLSPAAKADPLGSGGCAQTPAWDLGASAGLCLGTLEAGSQIPYWGGACVWVSGNQTGADPQHDCGIEDA